MPLLKMTNVKGNRAKLRPSTPSPASTILPALFGPTLCMRCCSLDSIAMEMWIKLSEMWIKDVECVPPIQHHGIFY